MVYCGKPSKGCSHCRERKIRCDQREAGCGQCEKRQQKCPGYRNLVDLMFRDESSHVIRKAKARARKRGNLGIGRSLTPSTPSDSESRFSATPEPRRKPLRLVVPDTPAPSSPAGRRAEHDDGGSMLPSPDSPSWPANPPRARCYSLAPTCQEQGIAYFFSRYVTMDETACHQKFDFLREVWRPSSPVPGRQIDVVLASMAAVGLMGLASTRQSTEFMDAARKSYGAALQLTTEAIIDPVEAVRDTTMLSVLILGVFEMMTETTARRSTVDAFQRHINGAVALAVLRGPSQFKTRAGRRMFSMLCQRVIISCAQQNEPMKPELIALWHEMSQTLEAENPNKHLMPLVWQVLQLRAEIKNCSLTDPERIVQRSLAIEEQFENLTAKLPASWQYRTFQVTEHHPAVHRGIYHRYSSPHHANIWNCILTTRILLLETIKSEIARDLQTLSPLLPATPYLDEYQHARRKLRRLVHAITASIPQQLGLLNPADNTIGALDPASTTRIATVEIRQTPSPPTSPATHFSDSTSSTASPTSSSSSSSSSPASGGGPPRSSSGGGPTILDVTRARDADDDAGRYMLLASATSTVVWPLFVAGMSTACDAATRGWVVGRLRTLYMETGIRQADAVANLLEGGGAAAVDA
ncbi:hypothetical protein BT67DRAFT_393378, partial [Trichocladium antarcticum]